MPAPVEDLDVRVAVIQEWITGDPSRAKFIIDAWRIGVQMGAGWLVAVALLTPLPEVPFTQPLP